jgi:hypothetical protein
MLMFVSGIQIIALLISCMKEAVNQSLVGQHDRLQQLLKCSQQLLPCSLCRSRRAWSTNNSRAAAVQAQQWQQRQSYMGFVQPAKQRS